MRTDKALEIDILAAVLHDHRLVAPLFRLLEAQDFGSEEGRELFAAVSAIAKRDGAEAVAPATVRAELARAGTDEKRVLMLMDPLMGIGAVGSFEPKCRMLRDVRRRRRLEEGWTAMRSMPDVAEARAAMRDLLFEVDRLGSRDAATMGELLDEMMDERERELRDDSRIGTGLPSLDRGVLGGFAPGWFVVVGARTGVGKTLLAVQVTHQALVAGKRVLYVALEESRTQIVERLARHARRLPRVARGEMDPIFAAATDEALRSLPLIVVNTLDLQSIEAQVAERVMETEGLGLVVVDYVGLVRAGRFENRVQELGEITRRLKALAMEQRVPVLGLAQVNRAVMARSDRRPMLSDLRDSGSLEQDADVVVFVHRESEIGASDKGELLLAKNRYGPPGRFPIAFDYAVGRLQEVAR